MNAFKIANMFRLGPEHVQVIVRIDAKTWHKHKKNKQLGHLYGVDISNFLFREHGLQAYCPTVSDRDRAKNGTKLITMTYHDSKWGAVSVPAQPTFSENLTGVVVGRIEWRGASVELTIASSVNNVIPVNFIIRKRVA